MAGKKNTETDKNRFSKASKLSVESYKGVRDFFPEDMAVEKAIFDIWREVAEKYGYEEYAASVLEPAELYRAKSGEEIVDEQTYTFKDRGDREVTLRPEMTPTAARMVAARRRALVFPLRWYSIPNLFRYEQPQRGRLREHWQLNVDIFETDSARGQSSGGGSGAAEVEIISIAYDITKKYGLTDKHFEIRINSRTLIDYVMRDIIRLDDETSKKLSKTLDRKSKMESLAFRQKFFELIGESFKKTKNVSDLVNTTTSVEQHLELFETKNLDEFSAKLSKMAPEVKEYPGFKEIYDVIKKLQGLGIENVHFDPTLMRGFDYYTGIVFEIFDINPKNRRSIFGGGRYDDLLSLFGDDTTATKVTAVGFGAGDVIARDLMETYGTLERLTGSHTAADVSLCLIDETAEEYAFRLARILHSQNVRTFLDFSKKKTGDKIAAADKRRIPFVIVLGEEEVKSDQVVVKKLATKEEELFDSADFKDIGQYLRKS